MIIEIISISALIAVILLWDIYTIKLKRYTPRINMRHLRITEENNYFNETTELDDLDEEMELDLGLLGEPDEDW